MHPLKQFHRTTVWHTAHHYFDGDIPRADLYLAANSVDSADYAIAERLIGAFDAMYKYEADTIPPEKRPNGGIWEMVKHEFHGKAYQLLLDKDVKGLAVYLSNGLRESICYGLGSGAYIYKAMSNPLEKDQIVFNLIDRLLSLSESLGVVPCENPEQGNYGANVYRDIGTIVSQIEQTLGWPIDRPKVMGMFGLEVNSGLIDFRIPDDIYCANRLKTLRQESGNGNVCEIGGGFGGMALASLRSGMPIYYIVDLPLINVVQGYFLMKALGGDAVKMFGENIPDRQVNIYPYWEFFNREIDFTIVFNRDSLPEIPFDRAIEYINEIEERKCSLLSINQESMAEAGKSDLHQLNVFKMFAAHSEMYCSSRHPYWLRKGYVEELYKSK